MAQDTPVLPLLDYAATRVYLCIMKPWKRFVVVFIAYAMALLHTAVPHQHEDKAVDRTSILQTRHMAGTSVAGLLEMIFSTDLGYGHLETFQKSASPDIALSHGGVFIMGFLIPSRSLLTLSFVIPKPPSRFIEKLQKRLLLLSCAGFRAPPAFA